MSAVPAKPPHVVPAAVRAFLQAATPPAWVEAALARCEELLLDHANCEKKAAATALSLMFRYPQAPELARQMSRLAREELRHFEQVQKLLDERGVAWRRVPPSRYAQGLREAVRRDEPGRLVDVLITGALIEARSCERFALLAPRLDATLGAFYSGLLASEARHFEVYLHLARRFGGEVSARVEALGELEAELAVSPDTTFAFHSGPPPA